MAKSYQLNHREALIYGATLLPLNAFLKLYFDDQENHQDEGRNENGTSQARD